MAIGARKALQENTSGAEREHWMKIPFLGCDGLPKTGRTYVDRGTLQATVHIPANTGQALQMLVQAIKTGQQPAERTLTIPSSYPSLDSLAPKGAVHATI
jgi:ribose transport system substrate-binding protein